MKEHDQKVKNHQLHQTTPIYDEYDPTFNTLKKYLSRYIRWWAEAFALLSKKY